MINLVTKECNGCSTCFNICPKNAISMNKNSEGFLYPNIDYSKCIGCKLCVNKCPLNIKNKQQIYKTFYGWNKDNNIRKNGSSGGVFFALSEYVFKNNGVVFGVTYDYESNEAKHIMIESIDDMNKISKSKYIQSSVGQVYKEVKTQIEMNKLVLFCGTPCQVNGLCSFLGTKPDNLLLVDFVCHGVPSPLVWKYHLKNILKNDLSCESIDFRNKDNGAINYSLLIQNKSKKYKKGHNYDLFFKLFLSDTILRESCYSCKAKGKNRSADITISDFWGAENYGVSKKECNKGVSLFSVYNDKILNILRSSNNIYMREINNAVMENKPSFAKSATFNKDREIFFNGLTENNYKSRGKKVTKFFITRKVINKIKRLIKKIIGKAS